MIFSRCLRYFRGSAVVLFLLFATACSPEQLLYTDPLTRLAAPELLEAWNSQPVGSVRARVDLATGDLPALITKDLASRKTLPQVIVIPKAIAEPTLAEWKRSFPDVRVLRIQLEAVPFWRQLFARAAEGREPGAAAVALVTREVPEAMRHQLTTQWANATGEGRLDFLVFDQMTPADLKNLDNRLQTESLDLFLLNGQAGLSLALPTTPRLRVHSELSPQALHGFAGTCLVPDVKALAANLHAATANPQATRVENAWSVINRSP